MYSCILSDTMGSRIKVVIIFKKLVVARVLHLNLNKNNYYSEIKDLVHGSKLITIIKITQIL